MPEVDDSRELQIRSPFDGSPQRAMLRLSPSPAGPLPLVFAPHPFGWSVDEDYHGGCVGLKAPVHLGWRGVASDAGVAILQPEGHHRVEDRASMGYEGVVRDIPAWLDAVAAVVRLDRHRLYACGLSMGGLESLLVAETYPGLLAAAFVFNPVVDPAAWYEDLAATSNAEMRAEAGYRVIASEVGGTPAEVPEEYARRSALRDVDALRGTPLTIWWSHLDLVVPRQQERHGKRLYDEIKRLDPNAPVGEYNHTARYELADPPTDEQLWAIHETSDYAFATRWLLLHRRA